MGTNRNTSSDMCDACGGTGKPISGLPCMCKGTGRMSEAAYTLRGELVRVEAEHARLLAFVDEILDKNPNAVGVGEAADIAVEWHMRAHILRSTLK